MGQYYIYVHRDSNGNTFYIGKGKGDRAFDQDRSKKWYNKANGGYWVEIIADNLDESTALFTEMCMIKALNPNLANTREVKEVVSNDRYTTTISTLQQQVTRNSNQIEKNRQKIKKLQKRIDKIKLSDKENNFIGSSKATLPTKLLTEEERTFRKSIANKIRERNKLENKLNTIKHPI